jgi:hypothetical protein
MLKAYIDDSRMRQPPVYVLGGWVAPAKTWGSFSDAWQEVLRFGRHIEYFKFSEAMNFNGEFNEMTEEARNEKLRLLVRVIEEHNLLGIVSILPHHLFEPLFGRHPNKDVRNPYLPSFFGIISRLARHYGDLGVNEKIEFAFDYQPGADSMGMAQAGWELFRSTAPPKYRALLSDHPPTFHSDRDIVALQAADLHAGWTRAIQEADLLGAEIPRPPWGEIGSRIKRVAYVWTPRLAEAVFEEMFGWKPPRFTYTFHEGYRP